MKILCELKSGSNIEYTNKNRTVFVHKDRTTYGYRIVISKYYKVLRTETIKDMFGKEIEYQKFDTKPIYYGKLLRRY